MQSPSRCDPGYLARIAESPHLRAVKERAHGLLGLGAGMRVLDLGCGPAIDTIAFAMRVGRGGLVVGVDHDAAMTTRADRKAAAAGVGGFTRHLVARAGALPFGAAAFDACFCDRLLQHVPPARVGGIAAEMLRVVRPQGRIVVLDTDWATLSIASPFPWLERDIVHEFLHGFANPFSGRHLPELLQSAGLAGLCVESFDVPLGIESLEYLLAPTLARCVREGRFEPPDVQAFQEALRASRDVGWVGHLSTVLVAGMVGEGESQ